MPPASFAAAPSRFVRTVRSRMMKSSAARYLLVMLAACAAVSVIANLTDQPVQLTAVLDGQAPRAVTLEPYGTRPVTAKSSLRVGLAGTPANELLKIDPFRAYEVTPRADTGALRIAEV